MSSLATTIRDLIEQAGGNGGGGTGNGTGNGSGGNGTGNGGNGGDGDEGETGNGEDTVKGFHRHHLGGYGRYYCRCDKDTPRSQQCPNCKARKN